MPEPGASPQGPIVHQMLRHLLASEMEPARHLERAILLAMNSVQADRGFIVLLDGPDRWAFQVATHFDETEIRQPASEVSRTLIRRAADERRPVLIARGDEDPMTRGLQSAHGLQERSVMAVPFLYRDQCVAVLYLDQLASRHVFTERDVRILGEFADEAAGLLARSAELYRTNRDLKQAQSDLEGMLQELRRRHDFTPIIGRSAALAESMKIVARASAVDVPVLILGETGTGKELVARVVHFNSARSHKPFQVFNCAAVPANLMESELFGHTKGAFTGAATDKPGLVEAADGGTLFLDEVGEMPVEIQAKFLRFLQFGEVHKLGGVTQRHVNVRIVAATNRVLSEEVAAGRFREDLYFRLNVLAVTVPPLRDRRDDIPLLASHYLEKFAERLGKKGLSVDRAAMDLLTRHAWPGNVRELENILLRAAVLTDSPVIGADSLPPEIGGYHRSKSLAVPVPRNKEELAAGRKSLVEEATRRLECDFLKLLLETSAGNVSEAARISGFDRTSLYNLMKKHDVDPNSYKV